MYYMCSLVCLIGREEWRLCTFVVGGLAGVLWDGKAQGCITKMKWRVVYKRVNVLTLRERLL